MNKAGLIYGITNCFECDSLLSTYQALRQYIGPKLAVAAGYKSVASHLYLANAAASGLSLMDKLFQPLSLIREIDQAGSFSGVFSKRFQLLSIPLGFRDQATAIIENVEEYFRKFLTISSDLMVDEQTKSNAEIRCRNFVEFVTGSPILSDDMKIKIWLNTSDIQRLPIVHICTPQIDLSIYNFINKSNYELFSLKLEQAMLESGQFLIS